MPLNLDDLVSHLEESKFLRLFAHLESARNYRGGVGELNGVSVPVDLPNAEVHLHVAEKVGSMRTIAVSWLFQILHSPWRLRNQSDVDRFIARRLRRAFESIRMKTDVIDMLNDRAVMPLLKRYRSPIDLLIGDDEYPRERAYYVFTNLDHDLDDATVTAFAKQAKALYQEVLGDVCHDFPSFGLATPRSLADLVPAETEAFVLDLLRMPSSFYLLARDGRISVLPVTEHGSFAASPSDTSRKTGGLHLVSTSYLQSERVPTIKGLRDFEALLNSTRTKEQDIQKFLELHPQFLFALDERYCEVRSHVALLDTRNNRLVPDFMARIESSDVWNVIELKRPQDSLHSLHNGIQKVSAAVSRAVAEALRYRDVFSSQSNRRRMADRFGVAPYEPCMIVVIGRGRAHERFEWSSAASGLPKVELVSYDYMFERARACRAALEL